MRKSAGVRHIVRNPSTIHHSSAACQPLHGQSNGIDPGRRGRQRSSRYQGAGPRVSAIALVNGFMKNESGGIRRTFTSCRANVSATTKAMASPT